MLRMTVVTRATAQVGFETSVADRILLRAPARRWDADGAVTRTPRYWNMWWTLTMAAAGLTLLVVVLEALGILKDLGPALGVVGVLLTIVFGLTASTRSSLTGFRDDVVPRLDRIVALLEERLPPTTT